MGGCFTIVLQGQHQLFDGVALLGFSGIHTVVPSRPGTPAIPSPWMLRGGDPANPKVLNQAVLAAAAEAAAAGQDSPAGAAGTGEHPFTYAFHWDTEPLDIVATDMAVDTAATGDGPIPPWRSPSVLSCGAYMVTPGTVAAEAAAIRVPVLIAVGERDGVPNPWLEPIAYKSSADISVYVCPRMAHMHNFADTRHELWARIHAWGTGVAATRAIRAAADTAG